jgi:hypothetical protein
MKHAMRPFAALLLLPPLLDAQFPPGYIDPQPVLQAARKAIGADSLRCVTVAGTAYAGIVGQQRESAWNVDWPRGEPLANYTRTMNWEAGTMKEEFDRAPGLNPASWKHGLGWRGGTPLQQHRHQAFLVNGAFGWHIDGPGSPPVAAPPGDAELWQLELWINPHGFLKAAAKPGANPRAVWRWELGESGRDGPTTVPEKVRVVSITVLGKYRVDATVNKENLLQRIHTWVPDPVLGDTNFEHEFANDTYIDLGGGMRFPTVWHSHTGWDDNYGALNTSAGHNGFGGPLRDVRANACPDAVAVPPPVRAATFPVRVEVERVAPGVLLMGGASHNSLAVEFDKFVAVVEAPLDETRSLAVIEEVARRFPDKPIRFLVNTHQHFDHIGGLRTYMHIGATIVTHFKNLPFYTRDVLNYAPRTLAPDMLSLWPPTEVAEGYQYEAVRENYVIADSARSMHISYVQPLAHAEGMLMVYLPKERVVVEADLPRDALAAQVRRLGLDVATVVPLHGRPRVW